MSDHDRFVAFLRRVAPDCYHPPPDTPRERVWEGLAERLAEEGSLGAGEGDETRERDRTGWTGGSSTGDLDPSSYHAPPEPPRELMWERIESAWALQRAASSASDASTSDASASARVGVSGEGDASSDRGGRARDERRSAALWIGGLAVAASLVIGIALGRGTVGFGTSGPGVAVAPTETGPAPSPAGSTVDSGSDESGAPLPSADLGQEPLETAVRLAEASDAAASEPPASGPVATEDVGRATDRRAPDRSDVVARYATARHLGRAETLLTAFRSGGEIESVGEMAGWARELLGETRLLLDMPVDRSPRERDLLREIELLLAQIARLGPDAPDFERDLITEGLERRGTLTQLRSVDAAGT